MKFSKNRQYFFRQIIWIQNIKNILNWCGVHKMSFFQLNQSFSLSCEDNEHDLYHRIRTFLTIKAMIHEIIPYSIINRETFLCNPFSCVLWIHLLLLCSFLPLYHPSSMSNTTWRAMECIHLESKRKLQMHNGQFH